MLVFIYFRKYSAMKIVKICFIKTGILCVFLFNTQNTFADTKIPDAGTVLNEIPEQDVNTYQKSNVYIDSQATVSDYSTDPTPIPIRKILVTGNTIIESNELTAITSEYENSVLKLADIQKLVDKITSVYVKKGYFTSRAYLPKQEILDGVLKINIIEAKIGKIQLNNQSHVSDGFLLNYLDELTQHNPIQEKTINRKLLLINDIDGVNITQARLLEGKDFATSDLILDTNADKRFKGQVVLDNYGSTYTGQYRVTTISEINSLFGYGEKISTQFLLSDQDLKSASLNAKIPLQHDGLNFQAKFSRTEYRLGQQFKILDASGLSNLYSLGFNYPLIRSQDFNLTVDTSFDHKHMDDEISATEVFTQKQSENLNINFNLNYLDGLILGGFSQLELAYSYGDLDIKSPTALNIDHLSAKTNGNFHKLDVKFFRQQLLTNQFFALLAMSGQLSSKNLDSSEKFGFSTMRAYPASEAMGDQGWNASFDLYYKYTDLLNFYVFQDFGETWQNKNKYLVEKNNRYLASSGFGLLARFNHFDMNGSIGWRNTSSALNDQDQNPRFLVQSSWHF